MAEKDKVTEQKMKKSGLFDFKETYQFIYRLLDEDGYIVEETKYQETIKGEAKDVEFEWKAEKKISDYFQNEIKLKFRILGMKSVEVQRDSERVKINEGIFEVKVTGTLVKDYESTWETNPSMKFLRGIYDRYIVEATIKKYERNIFKDVEDTLEQTKAFLALSGTK